jgi:uncharacterized protein YheU (UPF0270 family)
VKATKPPKEQVTKRPYLLREISLLLASDSDEGTDRATGEAASSLERKKTSVRQSSRKGEWRHLLKESDQATVALKQMQTN